MAERIRIALVYGGRSAEHEVSLRSAASVFRAVDKTTYDPLLVFISPEGEWRLRDFSEAAFSTAPLDRDVRLLVSPDPSHRGFLKLEGDRISPLPVDVVFPILHGTYGEDGTVQGLLELADIPYVGCGVAASAVSMDKALMKAAFRDAGLAVSPFFSFRRTQWQRERSSIMARLERSRFPVFVKPANLGSSVGITKVNEPSLFEEAVDYAAEYDRKIVVEDGVVGRELEVSVLGNETPRASVPGEVISHSNFYDYAEKYLKDTAELVIPAHLEDGIKGALQEAAIRAYTAVDASGLSRVDLFLTPNSEVIVNEINTLPGFTSISMYPKLWEASGLSYASLLDRLVELAFERHAEKHRTTTVRCK